MMVLIGRLAQVNDISRRLVLSLTCRDRPVDVLRLDETVKLESGPYLKATLDKAGVADVHHGSISDQRQASNIAPGSFPYRRSAFGDLALHLL